MAAKKAPNFTELEKAVLLELVSEKKSVIESKQNDGRMICKKKKEWENIENAFNARHGVNTRSITQLKSLWKNLKARAKADVAKERRDRRKTGGGPMEKNTDNISNAISEMIPQQINSLENAFDDDASFHGDELEKENEEDSDDDSQVNFHNV